ncbi:hypothetical protein LXM88_29060 [Burkholderia sp. S-53]|nr:hypothetical protein LXM88_29060 [Burkholderia sp. S-53]
MRAHWRIENSMHWVLDMAFGEDQCGVRVDNAAQNFEILRRICLTLLKVDTTTKAGIKNRRPKAGVNDATVPPFSVCDISCDCPASR